ncbi:hypothetical protein Cgig2_010795 [Carnegiea gigantea]|uniref:Uncharacterized protein n=1 Tax=Carnegiea gigantea TaxID=171969 RepID=A0A9Q1GNX8_9CARY|nr:hypothetical protein Cgig2_010795 [Carnegiea gigantea]
MVQVVSKSNKLALKPEGDHKIDQKGAQSQQEQPLKSEVVIGNEKRTYQKAFIMRMTTHSFSPLVAQLNKDQTEAVGLMVDLKQIPGKFSKWLVESFDPYIVNFRLPKGQNTMVMKATVELHNAHMEFVKLQPKQQPNKDDGGRSFSPTLALSQPDSEAPILATTSVTDSSVDVDKEEHR